MERMRGSAGAMISQLRAWVTERAEKLTPRRALTVVVALSLWMGTGGMTASVAPIPSADGEVGEVHWYVAESGDQ